MYEEKPKLPIANFVLAILIQTVALVWFAATLNAQVQQQDAAIKELKDSQVVPLTRQQLDDILLTRDTRIGNIETALTRIESSLNQALKK